MSVHYKKPGPLNSVSFLLVVILGLAGYAAFVTWPAIALHSAVKNELEGQLPALYQANIRPEPLAREGTAAVEKATYEALRKVGVTDKNLKVTVARSKVKVSIDAIFTSQIVVKALKKTYTVPHHPHVEGDATRVDW